MLLLRPTRFTSGHSREDAMAPKSNSRPGRRERDALRETINGANSGRSQIAAGNQANQNISMALQTNANTTNSMLTAMMVGMTAPPQVILHILVDSWLDYFIPTDTCMPEKLHACVHHIWLDLDIFRLEFEPGEYSDVGTMLDSS